MPLGSSNCTFKVICFIACDLNSHVMKTFEKLLADFNDTYLNYDGPTIFKRETFRKSVDGSIVAFDGGDRR